MIENFLETTSYVINKINDRNDKIKQLRIESENNKIPIITKEVLEFLIFQANNINAKNILEIGTATGYSGIHLCEISSKNKGRFISIEIDEKRYEIAKDNFKKFDFTNYELINGDAINLLDSINETFDFIFIDASKGQYEKFFDKSFEKLEKNGIIFIDNILFRGYLALDEYPKKYKTIAKNLDKFINKLYENYNFVLLPFGDGVGIVRK